jgi:magnesium-transporting ATPase (P-type)
MLYAGTSVLSGDCICVVSKIGDDTQMGTIKREMEEAKKSTEETLPPLKKQLNDFGTFLAKSICVICLLIWIVQIPKFFSGVHGGFILGALYYFK